MYHLLLLALTLLPLIGMYRMEGGGFGADISQTGYSNGGTVAFAWHFLVFWTVFLVVALWLKPASHRQTGMAAQRAKRNDAAPANFNRIARLVLLIQLCLFLFSLGPLGAYKVLFFGLNRGELRASFGLLGSLAFFQARYLSPVLCAFCAAIYLDSNRAKNRGLLLGICLLTALNIGVWGYRTAAITNLLPTLIVLFPTIRVSRSMLQLAVLLLAAVFLAQMIFGSVTDPWAATEVLWDRATTGTANVAWKIWDMHCGGHTFPSLWPTFWSILPNRLNEALLVWSRSSTDFYQYSFSGITTAIAADYHQDVDIRFSNVTATTFGTGVIAFGSPGYLTISALSGLFAVAVYAWIERSRRLRNYTGLALATNYAVSSVGVFLDNGDPASLFTVAILLYYVAAAKCCTLLLATQVIAGPRRTPARAAPVGRPPVNPSRTKQSPTSSAQVKA
ncbi:MAG: hypothetical protein KY475_01160 [Planctomycetes bacterium]|nr:hypothetical protein [Planctomycetota bacterium]